MNKMINFLRSNKPPDFIIKNNNLDSLLNSSSLESDIINNKYFFSWLLFLKKNEVKVIDMDFIFLNSLKSGNFLKYETDGFNDLLLFLNLKNTNNDNALMLIFNDNYIDTDSDFDKLFFFCEKLIAVKKNLILERNNQGESALSKLNKLINQLSIGWGNEKLLTQSLKCAKKILDSGCPIDFIKDNPPLEMVVNNTHLYQLLISYTERDSLELIVSNTRKDSGEKKGSGRL